LQNYSLIEKCTAISEIHEFISQLSDGYSSRIGEDGSWLSGGQRQRLGLARALYKGGDVLVLDEATTGLDEQFENKIIDNILKSKMFHNVIFVTHRSILKYKFDTVFELKNGKLLCNRPLEPKV
jgi:ABC-type bacteriocin/lantibiotic exporter with double-glycine peptidase domain